MSDRGERVPDTDNGGGGVKASGVKVHGVFRGSVWTGEARVWAQSRKGVPRQPLRLGGSRQSKERERLYSVGPRELPKICQQRKK